MIEEEGENSPEETAQVRGSREERQVMFGTHQEVQVQHATRVYGLDGSNMTMCLRAY